MKKSKLIIIIVIVAVVAFYVGMKIGQGQTSGTPVAQQSGFPGGGNGGAGGGGGTRRAFSGGNGFTGGQIISVDATGITLKTQNGGSQIVLVSGMTPIMKSTAGTMNDLTVGENVTVTGSQNSDGSITAQSVQIRPTGMPGFGGGRRQATSTP